MAAGTGRFCTGFAIRAILFRVSFCTARFYAKRGHFSFNFFTPASGTIHAGNIGTKKKFLKYFLAFPAGKFKKRHTLSINR